MTTAFINQHMLYYCCRVVSVTIKSVYYVDTSAGYGHILYTSKETRDCLTGSLLTAQPGLTLQNKSNNTTRMQTIHAT